MQGKDSRFEKMFAHIAFGLQEQLCRPNPEEYHYGLLLRQGINMFSALAVEFSGMKGDELKNYLITLNETEMIRKKFTHPVAEWFDGWDDLIIQDIKKSSFWDIGSLIYLDEEEKNYMLTGECLDYLNSVEKDLTAIDEHRVFNLMKELSQDNYVYVRKFIIEHPLLTVTERKQFLLYFQNDQHFIDLIDCAYEKIPEEAYLCSNCGWTITFKGLQPSCCHKDCVELHTTNEKCKKIEENYVYRLKKGVMRYICYPGKTELEIEDICMKLNVKSELWPELDRYDIKIIFDTGACWGIDAKTYCNPYFLSKSIEKDNNFNNAAIDKGYYVIPDKIINRTGGYLKICEKALLGDKKIKCISVSKLKKMIKQEATK